MNTGQPPSTKRVVPVAGVQAVHQVHKSGVVPVIVYENTPKIIHARPQEFKTVVQRLTGKPTNVPMAMMSSMPSMPVSFSNAGIEEGGDPLLLTLGQRQAAPPTSPVLPSPVAAGLLMTPSFIFSPNMMQSVQELSPLF